MLIAGPVLWLIGSIHNSCQIYERADGHVQILQECVNIPFLLASLLFVVATIINRREQSTSIFHGIMLLVSSFNVLPSFSIIFGYFYINLLRMLKSCPSLYV